MYYFHPIIVVASAYKFNTNKFNNYYGIETVIEIILIDRPQMYSQLQN